MIPIKQPGYTGKYPAVLFFSRLARKTTKAYEKWEMDPPGLNW